MAKRLRNRMIVAPQLVTCWSIPQRTRQQQLRHSPTCRRSQAYEVLSSEEARMAYDARLAMALQARVRLCSSGTCWASPL